MLARTLSSERLETYYTLSAEQPGYTTYLTRTLSWGVTYLYWQNNYDIITPRIILGVMPTQPLDKNITMFVSISTYGELATGFFPGDIKHVFLHIPDETADVTAEDALDVVLQMRDFLVENPQEKILIHCRAGKGRSVMMCAALLALFPREAGLDSDETLDNADAAFDYVQKKRTQALKEENKLEKTREIIALNKNNPTKITEQAPCVTNDYLASNKGKDAIRRLKKFIELATFAASIKATQPSAHQAIQEFFYYILHSTDGKWYDEFSQGKGPIFALPLIQTPLDHFKTELENHLATIARPCSTLEM